MTDIVMRDDEDMLVTFHDKFYELSFKDKLEVAWSIFRLLFSKDYKRSYQKEAR